MGKLKREIVTFFINHCCICYKPITQKHAGRKRRTCSSTCRTRLFRLREQGIDPTQKIFLKASEIDRSDEADRSPARLITGFCPVCGRPLRQKPKGRKRITCSDACRQKLWRLRHPVCPVCGKRFEQSNLNQVYCSMECKRKMENSKRHPKKTVKTYVFDDTRKYYGRPPAQENYRMEYVPWIGPEKENVIWEKDPEDCWIEIDYGEKKEEELAPIPFPKHSKFHEDGEYVRFAEMMRQAEEEERRMRRMKMKKRRDF